jgi:hypothetical protein
LVNHTIHGKGLLLAEALRTSGCDYSLLHRKARECRVLGQACRRDGILEVGVRGSRSSTGGFLGVDPENRRYPFPKDFYGFTRMPFGRDLAPGMLHRHASHSEAVARINWCIAERSIGVVTGEVGAGKTVYAPS